MNEQEDILTVEEGMTTFISSFDYLEFDTIEFNNLKRRGFIRAVSTEKILY